MELSDEGDWCAIGKAAQVVLACFALFCHLLSWLISERAALRIRKGSVALRKMTGRGFSPPQAMRFGLVVRCVLALALAC